MREKNLRLQRQPLRLRCRWLVFSRHAMVRLPLSKPPETLMGRFPMILGADSPHHLAMELLKVEAGLFMGNHAGIVLCICES